jgi:hypothetical protein
MEKENALKKMFFCVMIFLNKVFPFVKNMKAREEIKAG